MTYYAINPQLKKGHRSIYGCCGLAENKLPSYNPFLSLRGFHDLTAWLHLYWNQLDTDLDYVGIVPAHYTHGDIFDDAFFDDMEVKMYLNNVPDTFIVQDGQWVQDENVMTPFLAKYNTLFETAYTVDNLEGMIRVDPRCGIFSADLFRSLGFFLSNLLDDVYKMPQTYWGVNAYNMYCAISLFVSVRIREGVMWAPLPVTPPNDPDIDRAASPPWRDSTRIIASNTWTISPHGSICSMNPSPRRVTRSFPWFPNNAWWPCVKMSS